MTDDPSTAAAAATAHAWVAEPDEAEVVAGLLVEFRDWHGRDRPSADAFLESVRRLVGRPDTEFLLAGASAAGPAVGVCQLRYRHSVWTSADDCWLEDLYVRDEARGRSVGRVLVQAAVDRAARRGCRRVELDVNERNSPALALYGRVGFEVSHKPPGGRDVLMRRWI